MSWALALLLAGCAGRAEVADDAPVWGAARPTQLNRYHVALELQPDPPPMGELFAVQAQLTLPDGTPVDNATLELDARMPQHGHGMMTDPIERPGDCGDAGCVHPDGIYVADGFKFHMAGDWTLIVDVKEGPRGEDRTTFVYGMAP